MVDLQRMPFSMGCCRMVAPLALVGGGGGRRECCQPENFSSSSSHHANIIQDADFPFSAVLASVLEISLVLLFLSLIARQLTSPHALPPMPSCLSSC